MTLEWFSNDCGKTNTKLITLMTNYKGENNAMNQSEFLAITYNLHKAQETLYDWFWFCFSLVEKLTLDF